MVGPAQLSVPTGAVYVTTALHKLLSLLLEMFDGQTIIGTCVSFTVIVKEHVAVPQEFDTVIVTLVVPRLNADPLPVPLPLPVVAPVKLYVTVGEVPPIVGAYVDITVHIPGDVFNTILEGQDIVGAAQEIINVPDAVKFALP